MKKYLGAKYIGRSKLRLASGKVINYDEIIEMPEKEAIERKRFEPVYEAEKKQFKKEDG